MSFGFILLFWVKPAFAWNLHQEMIDQILSGPAVETRAFLSKKIQIPCEDEEKREIQALASRIQIRAEAVPHYSKNKCSGKAMTQTVLEILQAGFIDEPDLGMDQDLPQSADPHEFRKWMGGVTGPTSQGFRHMLFPGVIWSSPLKTLQIPLTRVGEAISRIEVLKNASDEYFKSGKVFWGLRTLLWREHLIEDLHQPFHSTQVPSLKMLPMKRIFHSFVQESTHALSNYHYAYEGLALEMTRGSDESGGQNCFTGTESHPFGGEAQVLQVARSHAAPVGDSIYSVFRDYLKSDAVDLPQGIGEVDYYVLLHAKAEALQPEEEKELSPQDLRSAKQSVEAVRALEDLKHRTCELMQEVTAVFWGDLDQVSTSILTGK